MMLRGCSKYLQHKITWKVIRNGNYMGSPNISWVRKSLHGRPVFSIITSFPRWFWYIHHPEIQHAKLPHQQAAQTLILKSLEPQRRIQTLMKQDIASLEIKITPQGIIDKNTVSQIYFQNCNVLVMIQGNRQWDEVYMCS